MGEEPLASRGSGQIEDERTTMPQSPPLMGRVGEDPLASRGSGQIEDERTTMPQSPPLMGR